MIGLRADGKAAVRPGMYVAKLDLLGVISSCRAS